MSLDPGMVDSAEAKDDRTAPAGHGLLGRTVSKDDKCNMDAQEKKAPVGKSHKDKKDPNAKKGPAGKTHKDKKASHDKKAPVGKPNRDKNVK